MAEITVKWVETPVEIEIDMGRLTWGDLLRLKKAQQADLDDDKAAELITGLVTKITGQDAMELPAQVVAKIANEISERAVAVQQAKN